MSKNVERAVVLTKDAGGSPAVDLNVVKQSSPTLAKVAEKAGFALAKRDLSGIRAQVVVLLDRSGSMRTDYQSGAVQTLVERVLGFALQVDADGSVPVIPFDNETWPAVNVTQANFSAVVANELSSAQMGSTNLTDALAQIKKLADNTDQPLFVAVVTDGNPDDKTSATQLVCELAGYPAFLKFLALAEVPYLSELDDLDSSRRLLDNVDAKPEKGSGLNLLACSDAEFVEALVDEWDTWIAAATAAGVLKV